MILFIPYKIMLLDEGDVGIFGFGHFLGRFFGFCTEKLRFLSFVGHCGFRFFGFLAPGFLAKIKQVRFLSGSLRSPDVRLFYMFLFYWHGRSENVSERKTVGREKGRACKHLLKYLNPPTTPPTSPKHNLQGRIRASSRAKLLSKVTF